MAILITGGAGYIGSHTAVELLNYGEKIVIIDNFINSSPHHLKMIKTITQKDFKFYEINCCDEKALSVVFKENDITSVIHFAGLKAVGESVKRPLLYYQNNLSSTISLLQVMQQFNCKNLIFSSSATVYGIPKEVPIKEDAPMMAINPYGQTKIMIEQMLKDISLADREWKIAILRYFNPLGAHPSGLIGENPKDIPNNLLPYICKVATKKLPFVKVFGNDYPTPDGTGIRDYIHVADLAHGHLKAMLFLKEHTGIHTFNLGTGTGYSVLEVIHAFEKASHIHIPYQITKRRSGDVAVCYADPQKSKKLLHWQAKYHLNDMCKDAWNYIKKSSVVSR